MTDKNNYWPLIVSTRGLGAAGRQRISRAERSGDLLGLGYGLYTSRVNAAPSATVKSALYDVLGALYPGAVVSARTAIEGGPKDRGVVFLTHDGPSRDIHGLSIKTSPGAGCLEGDTQIGDTGIYIAGEARNLLENLIKSRQTSHVSRTIGKVGVEARLDRIARAAGASHLNKIRDTARRIAPQLEMVAEQRQLEEIIGGLAGTKPVSALSTSVGRARAAGMPVDADRISDFQKLVSTLLARPQSKGIINPDTKPPSQTDNEAFFESYFSNYIEGTEFELSEARSIVYDAEIPKKRPSDAHDILGVYAAVLSRPDLWAPISGTTKQRRDEFVDRLRESHRVVFSRRPEVNPGQFKQIPNRAGIHSFVLPDDVLGTLGAGFDLIDPVQDPVARAVLMHHLISEVHPFVDGNGRVSRLFMNAELSRHGITRVIVPTILRDEYIAGARNISQQGRPQTFIRVIDTCQELHEKLDTKSFENTAEQLKKANAFYPSGEALALGIRFTMPKIDSTTNMPNLGHP